MHIKGIALRAHSRGDMQLLTQSRVTRAAGVEGDFRGRPSSRQVTVLSESSWRKTCAELGVDLPWHTRRANLLLSDYEFDIADLGQIIQIGQLKLRISRETMPCRRMDELHPGLTAALRPEWRGGVCCRVMESGEIHVGDEAHIVRADALSQPAA